MIITDDDLGERFIVQYGGATILIPYWYFALELSGHLVPATVR